MKARLYQKYTNEVVPALKEKNKYANVHQIPKMEKIVVNMGISASLEKGAVEDAAKDQRSLNLGGFAIQKPQNWMGVVRHEFLHALGFEHEHQSPVSVCETEFRWDDDSGYDKFDPHNQTAQGE